MNTNKINCIKKWEFVKFLIPETNACQNKKNVCSRSELTESQTNGFERFADCFEKKDTENYTYISNKALNHISISNRF